MPSDRNAPKNIDPDNGEEIIMPDEVRPALADMEPDVGEQEPSGQDELEDETRTGRVIRPA
jgi:hypothetical protein